MFRGLLPSAIDAELQYLLFSLAHWHGLAKLRLHTTATLKHLANETTKIGEKLRAFQDSTNDLVVYETPREFRARQRRVATRAKRRNDSDETLTLTRKHCKLNLNTFKFHALGDYAAVIARNGTTDSFSTQAVSLL